MRSVKRALERRVERELVVPDAAVAFTVPFMVPASVATPALETAFVKIKPAQQNTTVYARMTPGTGFRKRRSARFAQEKCRSMFLARAKIMPTTNPKN